jgi:hypothetical protein
VLRAQLPAQVAVQSVGENCFGTTEFFAANGFYFDDLCAPAAANKGLDAGTYRVAVLPAGFDGWACDSGRNAWVLETIGSDCAGATFTTQPRSQTLCGGTTGLTFTANATTSGALSWAWEFGENDGNGGTSWTRLEDGELRSQVGGAQGTVLGTSSNTVTFSNVLTGGGFALRAVAIACGESFSNTALVTLGLPGDPNCGNTPTCNSIDFNGDGLFPSDEDLVDYLAVLAGGECPTGRCEGIDFNNDGLFPSDEDLIAFLRVLAGGAC